MHAAGVAVSARAGHLRAAFHLYTTEADVDRLLDLLAGQREGPGRRRVRAFRTAPRRPEAGGIARRCAVAVPPGFFHDACKTSDLLQASCLYDLTPYAISSRRRERPCLSL